VIVLDPPLVRAVRRAALVVGAGAVGAAVCSAGVGAMTPHGDDFTVAPAVTAAYAPARTLSPEERRAVGHLRRAVTAERTATYSGTKWMSSQTGVTVVEVRHTPSRGTWLDVRTSAGGGAGPVRTAAGTQADLDGEALTALSHHYTLAVRGRDQCAGRPVTLVEARRLGTDRVAGRFWLDEATGLLLRRELYDATGEVVRATLFVRLDTGAQAAAVPAETRGATRSGRARIVGRALGESGLAQLRRDGWYLPDVLPGGMERYRATEMTVDGDRVVQLAYSDGIFAASLFVQQGDLDPRSLRGFRSERMAGTTVYTGGGLHRTVVWGGRTAVYTLVLDAPEPLGPQLVAALPHTPADDGPVARLSRGIQRVGSWVNPFD
jgi:sigma-E factor negative regulatory protein RseB